MSTVTKSVTAIDELISTFSPAKSTDTNAAPILLLPNNKSMDTIIIGYIREYETNLNQFVPYEICYICMQYYSMNDSIETYIKCFGEKWMENIKPFLSKDDVPKHICNKLMYSLVHCHHIFLNIVKWLQNKQNKQNTSIDSNINTTKKIEINLTDSVDFFDDDFDDFDDDWGNEWDDVVVPFAQYINKYPPLKNSFRPILKNTKIISLLAQFANNILKKGTNINTTISIEDMIDSIVFLYAYSEHQDTFQNDFTQLSTRRLLTHASISIQLERLMIDKLTETDSSEWSGEWNDWFTLNSMLKDVEKSEKLMTEFLYSCDKQKIDYILNVIICTANGWSLSKHKHKQSICEPIDVKNVTYKFKRFCENKHPNECKCKWMKLTDVKHYKMHGRIVNGKRVNFDMDIDGRIKDTFSRKYYNYVSPVGQDRMLVFQMDQGVAEICVQFNRKTEKIFKVSTYQMVILLLFNDAKTLSFGEIMYKTCISESDLMIAMLSMAHPKVKIIRKMPNTAYIEHDHKFQINSKYSNHASIIDIPIFCIKEGKLRNKCDVCDKNNLKKKEK